MIAGFCMNVNSFTECYHIIHRPTQKGYLALAISEKYIVDKLADAPFCNIIMTCLNFAGTLNAAWRECNPYLERSDFFSPLT